MIEERKERTREITKKGMKRGREKKREGTEGVSNCKGVGGEDREAKRKGQRKKER